MGDICLLVPSSEAQMIRKCLEKHQLVNTSKRLKFLKDENKVAIPVCTSALPGVPSASKVDITDIQEALTQVLGDVSGNGVVLRHLTLPCVKKLAIKKPETALKDELKKLLERAGEPWTEEVSRDVPVSWERHGDLVLLPAAAFTLPVWRRVGDEVWRVSARCLGCVRVAQKGVVCTDGYRTPQVTMLYGTSGWVEQVDNGIKYTYDVTRCMFSSGNITEKLRVARFDCSGEVVVDMYAGIGYFTLPYLVYTGVKHLHACEWNPCAVEALRRNLQLNNIQDRCTIHEGDNRRVCPQGVADRVNLGLIPSSREGWPVACAALKPQTGGILHIHYNVNTKSSTPAGAQSIRSESRDTHWKLSEIGNTQPSGIESEPKEKFRQEAKCPLSENVCQTNAYHIQETMLDGKIESKVLTSMGEHSVNCGFTELSPLEITPDAFAEEREQNMKQNNCFSDRNSSDIQSSSSDADNCSVSLLEDKANCDSEHLFPELLGDEACGKESVVNDRYAGIHSELNTSCTGHTHSNTKHLAEIGGKCVGEMFKILSDESCDIVSGTKSLEVSMGNLTQSHASGTVSDNIHASKWFPWAIEVSMEICKMLRYVHGRKWSTEILHIEHVKSYAPFVDHIVLDLKCEPLT